MKVHEIPLSKMFYMHREIPLLDSALLQPYAYSLLTQLKKLILGQINVAAQPEPAYLNMMENSHLHSYVASDTL